jgi:hypothetical protein
MLANLMADLSFHYVKYKGVELYVEN